MLATRNGTRKNRRRCASNNHFIKKEKAQKQDTLPSEIHRATKRRGSLRSAMDISKRTGNCVLSISETTELNATTDADLIVAASISNVLRRREWVVRDSLPMLTVKSLKKVSSSGFSYYVTIFKNHFVTKFVTLLVEVTLQSLFLILKSTGCDFYLLK